MNVCLRGSVVYPLFAFWFHVSINKLVYQGVFSWTGEQLLVAFRMKWYLQVNRNSPQVATFNKNTHIFLLFLVFLFQEESMQWIF